MKIVLCCTTIEDGHRDDEQEDSHYPLGLGYLQAYLEKHGDHDVKSLYLNNVNYDICHEKIKTTLEEFKPDMIGVSIMTHSRVSAYRTIEWVHETYPDMHIVIGGMHVSVLYEQMVKKYPYVVAAIGEGEETLNEIIKAYESGGKIGDVLGIAYHDGEKVVMSPRRPLIQDLDTLPFPRHDLFIHEGKKMANLLTSRGCPFKCNFCVLDHTSRRKVRFRSGENIADEVEMILTKHPSIESIWIHDDAFMINKDRTLDFCEAIIRRGIKTSFVASARFNPIDENVVRKMEQAGFTHVLFGLESGAASVMKGMRKGITKQHAIDGMKLFAEVAPSIKTTAFLIVGLPGETDDTIEETIDFVQQLQSINYTFYDDIGVCILYPGTEVYAMSVLKGKINDDYWLTDKPVPYYTPENGGVYEYDKLIAMKTRLRHGIALQYLLSSPVGFILQRKLIPKIIEYSMRFGMGGLFPLFVEAINRFSLGMDLVSGLYDKNSYDVTKRKLNLAVEKVILEQILNSIRSDSDRTTFFRNYKDTLKTEQTLSVVHENRL